MQNNETKKPLIGAHMSIAGGVHTAFDRGKEIGCRTMQVFTKNSNQWFAKPLTDDDIRLYREKSQKSSVSPVIAHDSYLINLCAKSPEILQKSRDAFLDEVQRCEVLGIPYLNFHPGSHMGQGEKEGIGIIAESINLIHEKTKGYSVRSVLETTAGQGTSLGWSFGQLRQILDLVDDKDRIGVCIDTCHIFAAGYNIGTEDGYEKTFQEFNDVIGLDRIVAFHVNDSKKGFESRVDRHEHIGKGAIGLVGFSLLMNDTRFHTIPKILETPKSDDMHEDVMNLKILEGLVNIRT
jgi:deoxyribonuclease IV